MIIKESEKTKLDKIEKIGTISQKHAKRGIEHIERLLPYVNLKENQYFFEVGCGNGHVCKYLPIDDAWPLDVDPLHLIWILCSETLPFTLPTKYSMP